MLYEAAKVHGSLVSLNELVLLMPDQVSENELVEAIRSHPGLKSKFTLESGFVIEKNSESDLERILRDERDSRIRAVNNLRHAARFIPLLASSRFEIVGVSGSTSYQSVSRSKDLDLFCVAPGGSMWISLTKALILARAFSLTNGEAPPICLSCVMDEEYARMAFSADQGALFARDALQTVIVRGEPSYRSLLRGASWISRTYPVAFARRSTSVQTGSRTSRGSSAWARALNSFFFLLTGTYVRAKSFALNRRLVARGQFDSAFAVRMGEDHLLYESRRYRKLRTEYYAASPDRFVIEATKR